MLVEIHHKTISVLTFEEILKKIAGLDGKSITLDLTPVEFIDPYGLTALINLVRFLSSKFENVNYTLPHSARILSYLERMNFFHLAGEINRFSYKPLKYFKRSFQPLSDVLIPLTAIRDEGDILFLVQTMMNHLEKIFQHSLFYRTELRRKICVALAEICQNIPQHSRDWGVVVAQTYFTKITSRHFIKIAVGDLGIGIRKSLASKYKEENWNDCEAIMRALELGVSRVEDAGRGLGLARVKELVHAQGGIMHLRSGTARLYLAGGKMYNFSTPYFPGTQIMLELPESKQLNPVISQEITGN